MKKILAVTVLMLSLACTNAQKPPVVGTGVKITAPPSEKVLIADETEIIASGKTGFRIITSNDDIARKLMSKFEDNGMTKFTSIPKKDRHGKYKESTFYFKNESWNAVTMFVNNGFK